MGAWRDTTQPAPLLRGVVGRAASTSVFDLARWAPSDAAAQSISTTTSTRQPHGWMSSLPRAPGELDPTYVPLMGLIDRIRDDDRLHRVEQVMPHSPWSARTTQRVFRRYVGVPVKWVLCRYRLQQAVLEIESHPGVDFADLAVRLGWYDQAHFIKTSAPCWAALLANTPPDTVGEPLRCGRGSS
jgi:AraC-like DNA-binding protein